MSSIKGSKKGITKNGEYGVKVAFEYIERQCKREHLPVPNITGGQRTRLIQNKYGLPYCYWNGTTHKGAVYKYKGFVLWQFIDLFMEDYRAVHKKTKKPEQLTLFDEIPEPVAVTSEQIDPEQLKEDLDRFTEYTITKHKAKKLKTAEATDFEEAVAMLKNAVNVFVDSVAKLVVELERSRANGI